ncbi:hypothetical protein BAL199_18686 [alpha proteobacterium BAL199]|nr:hypothetical protein BAL199_18686 [alpha proteobacterium BAL199]
MEWTGRAMPLDRSAAVGFLGDFDNPAHIGDRTGIGSKVPGAGKRPVLRQTFR